VTDPTQVEEDGLLCGERRQGGRQRCEKIRDRRNFLHKQVAIVAKMQPADTRSTGCMIAEWNGR